MFVSSLTNVLFESFVSSASVYGDLRQGEPPYVFVDSTGVRLITDVLDSMGDDSTPMACFMAQNGQVEVLPMVDGELF